jgi:hypothetical protein
MSTFSCDIARTVSRHEGGYRFSSKALLARQREDRDRQAEPLVQLVEQPPLLPAGVVGRTERDQYVVCWKAGQRILESKHGIVSPDRAAPWTPQLLKLAENRSQPLVGLLAGFVRGRRQPFEARWQSR